MRSNGTARPDFPKPKGKLTAILDAFSDPTLPGLTEAELKALSIFFLRKLEKRSNDFSADA